MLDDWWDASARLLDQLIDEAGAIREAAAQPGSPFAAVVEADELTGLGYVLCDALSELNNCRPYRNDAPETPLRKLLARLDE